MGRWFLILAIGLTVGCGTKQDSPENTPEPVKPNHQSEEPSSDATTEEARDLESSLAPFTYLRVAIDEQGNETNRVTLVTSDRDVSGAELADQFDDFNIAAPVSELDAESSTQSWQLSQLSGQATYGQQYQGQNNGTPATPLPRNSSQRQGQPANSCLQQCPQQQAQCIRINCGTQVSHVQGDHKVVYPTTRKVIYKHNTVDVKPQEYVDVYPIETVKVHPTKRHVRVHPLQRKVVYANPCINNGCGGARYSNYWPTVNYRGYRQSYFYNRHFNYGGYRYYQYAKPSRYFYNW